MPKMNTSANGEIEISLFNNRLHGNRMYLHIDQSANIDNGEGEAGIVLNGDDVKGLISMLNDYIVYTEGKPFVVLADPLIHPDVKIVVEGKEVEKVPEEVNPYLAIEDVMTPGEAGIDYDDYFGSIAPRLQTPPTDENIINP